LPNSPPLPLRLTSIRFLTTVSILSVMQGYDDIPKEIPNADAKKVHI
jgi:hypothetical protein